MRTLLLILTISAAANVCDGQTTHNLILSRDWGDGKLTLKLDDGSAEIEWISPVAFRVWRTWQGDAGPSPLEINHEKVAPEFTDVGQTLTMKTRYITLTIDRGDMAMQVKSGDTPVSNNAVVRAGDGAELHLNLTPNERVFGVLGADTAKLNRRGATFYGYGRVLFFTTQGYGIYLRSSKLCVFNMTDGVIHEQGARSMEYLFYYGPTPKEIFEQHATVIGAGEVKSDALDLLTRAQLPKSATTLKDDHNAPADGALGRLVRQLVEASLSGEIYPAVDLADFDSLRGDARQRAKDLFTMLPIVFRSSGDGGIDAATRLKWRPYLITYLREAYDRGYPLIRPLPMQFSRDANSDRQSDVFMLGDEVLLAPVVSPGNKRRLDLPRGSWTDLRTNTEYRGNQMVEVDAPTGQVPMFVRNGWIVPLEIQTHEPQGNGGQSKMELHYFPSLGGEFFLWEPDLQENSQFHAAPAGDYMRVEIETKVRRTYEWVLHHTKAPREVEDESGAYERVDRREALKPGTWWHDAKLNNVHVMVRAEAGTDRIINMSF